MAPDNAGLPTQNLVALRDRREQAIARISECYAEDLIDVDELDRRLDLAHSARTVAELHALVADLAVPAATSTALVPARVASAATSLAVNDPSRAPAKRVRVIMSSIERRGPWVVPTNLELRTFWGNVELDFRDASLGAGVTTIDVSVTMANVEIILPPGLAVDVEVSAFASSVEERHRIPPDADPARPMLRFTGAVRFGNLEITTRLPGESARAARKRDKRERKALEAGAGAGAGAQKALPSSSGK